MSMLDNLSMWMLWILISIAISKCEFFGVCAKKSCIWLYFVVFHRIESVCVCVCIGPTIRATVTKIEAKFKISEIVCVCVSRFSIHFIATFGWWMEISQVKMKCKSIVRTFVWKFNWIVDWMTPTKNHWICLVRQAEKTVTHFNWNHLNGLLFQREGDRTKVTLLFSLTSSLF